MASPVQQALENLSERIDEDLLGHLYERASIPTSEIVSELTKNGLVWDDPGTISSPSRQELEDTSHRLIQSARRRASLRGALSGAVGLIAIPPETLAGMVQLLQLAQRLAVVWGHDPHADRGRVLLVRALSRALDLELPDQGQLSVRVRDLGRIAGRQLPDPRHTGVLVALSLARFSLGRVGSGLARAVPGVGALAGGLEARRSLQMASQPMIEVYSRAWRGTALLEGPVEDAEELMPSTLAALSDPS
jgi:hypothetical protein